MHQYISSVLRDAEKIIQRYLLFLVECRDSSFWPDIPIWTEAVCSCQRICSIYYEHWPSEFDSRLLKRYRKIIGFNWRSAYLKYFGSSSSLIDND